MTLYSTTEELKQIALSETGNYNYTVDDFCEKPKQSALRISPDGMYFSFRERDSKGYNHIYIKNIKTGLINKVIHETNNPVKGYGWANKNRMVYIKDEHGNANYQLFAIDLDGTNEVNLTPFQDVKVKIINVLKEHPNFLIIEMNKDNNQIFEPYRINVYTGELTKLFKNDNITDPIINYNFDKDGNLRAFTRLQDGVDRVLYYKVSNKESFEKIIQISWKESFYIIGFDYSSKDSDIAYVISNLENNTEEIILYDFLNRKILKKVFNHPLFDIKGLQFSIKRNYEIDYYHYIGKKQQIVPVSETYKKLYQKFKQQFKNKNIVVTNQTDDESKYLLLIQSDKLYGIYYLYDTHTDSFTEIINLMPKLKEKNMAKMQPIEFFSRDGLKLHGYLSIPSDTKNVSLVVMPHGGPYGIRNVWGFNPEVQLFANYGYATLQINYRGSGGYGKAFFLAGNKQVGRKMLNDLEDGIEYVKNSSLINFKKIAIYGMSYGGFAALGSLTKTPNLYSCGVCYSGLSNLFTTFKSIPTYWKPYIKKMHEQWYDENNTTERKIMEEVSPALNVAKIKKPVFIAHGTNDPKVSIKEIDQLVKELKNNLNEVFYMVKNNEGHGFYHDKNRIKFYKTLIGFFKLYLK